MAQKPKSIEECTEKTKNPIIVLEEKGKRMIFRNSGRKTVKKITVDGCAITRGIRCDYLVLNEKNDEFFVELKGTDIRHACDQLDSSIRQLSTDPKQKAKHSFVISSRFSPAINSTIQNLQRLFKDRFNCKLIIKNQQYEVEI
jgi:hypothetical protein